MALVIAPAGYGKTTALRHFLAESEVSSVYFGVRPQHQRLAEFVRGLVEAFDPAVPTAHSAIADVLRNAQSSTNAPGDLAQWVRAHLKRFDGIIAIDDLQLVDDEPDIVRFLTLLIESKDDVRWLLAARALVHFPVATWLAYGQADLPVNDGDLVLRPDEAIEIAALAAPALPTQAVLHLHDLTGGWPTAFRFALLAADASADIDQVTTSTRRLTYQYLAEQVYLNLGDDERSLLMFASLLPEIDPVVLEEAGFARARSILDGLRHRAAFLTVHGDAFRLHDLFREFLETMLMLQGKEFADASARKAGAALERCGRVADALRLYLKSNAYAQIEQLLRAHGFTLIDRGYLDLVERALCALPAESREKEPLLLGLMGRLETDAGRFERAFALQQRAVEACTDPELRAVIALDQSRVLFSLQKNPVELLEAVAFESGLSYGLRGELLSLLACGYAVYGPRERYDEILHEAEAFCHTVESSHVRAKIMQRLGYAAFAAGDPVKSARLSVEGATLAAANGMMNLAASAHTVCGVVAYLYDADLPRTLHYSERELESALKAGRPYVVRGARAAEAAFAAQMGDFERVERALRDFETGFEDEDRRVHDMVFQARGLRAMCNRQFEEARLCLERAGAARFAEDRTINAALHALAALALDRSAEVARVLGDARRDACDPAPENHRLAHIAQALLAVAESCAGKYRGRRCRSESSPAAEALGRIASAVARDRARGGEIGSLEEHYAVLRDEHFGGFAAALEAVFGQLSQPQERTVKLTPKEGQILRMLAEGMAPKEIAFETHNSVTTVRTHIRAIIVKFGCSGSDQAIRLARARGLLHTQV